MKRISTLLLLNVLCLAIKSEARENIKYNLKTTFADTSLNRRKECLLIRYYNTNQFIDAAYNSIMNLNSLIKKRTIETKLPHLTIQQIAI